MMFFSHRKVLIKKILLFVAVVLVQVVGLFIFAQQQESLEGMRWSYVSTVYLPSVTHSIQNVISNHVTGNLAFVAGSHVQSSRKWNRKTSNTTSIPVLLYHGVVEGASDAVDGSNILVTNFVSHMKALKEAGYVAISYAQFERFVKGDATLPEKALLLTFDDGRKDSYYPVDPILKSYGYNATIFVLPKYSLAAQKSTHYLSKRELQKMIKSGHWSIQSHGLNAHTYYPINHEMGLGYYYADKLWLADKGRIETDTEFKQRVISDMKLSRTALESQLGIVVSGIAYPFGQHGQNSHNYPDAYKVIDNVTQQSYKYAFYQVNPANGFTYYKPDRDGYMVRRIEPRPNWTGDDLLAVLEAGKEKTLPFIDNFKKFKGWSKLWGEYVIKDGVMKLLNTPFNKETFVMLAGAQQWDNYLYRADIASYGTTTVSLVVNMVDENHYQACTFSADRVRITSNLIKPNIEKEAILRKPIPSGVKAVSYGVRVEGNSISCLLDDMEILTLVNNRDVPKGTIGIKAWSPHNTAHIDIERLSVISLINPTVTRKTY